MNRLRMSLAAAALAGPLALTGCSGGDVDADAPEMSVTPGELDVDAPQVDAPDVDAPDVDVDSGELPDVDVDGGQAPDVDVETSPNG